MLFRVRQESHLLPKLLLSLAIILGIEIFALKALADNKCADKNPYSQIENIIKSEEDIQGKLDMKLLEAQDQHSTDSVTDEKDMTAKVEESQENVLENRLRVKFLYNFREKLPKNICNVKTEIPPILMELSHRELNACAESERLAKDCRTWRFISNLARMIKDIYEPSEDFEKFVRDFIIYSSVLDPKTTDKFLKNRDYIK